MRHAADVVLCTRFGPNSKLTGSMPPVKRFGNWLLCRLISMTVGERFTDVSCGFRAFTRDAAIRVDVHSDFEYIHESLLTWRRFGLRVVEVELPVRAEREVGESRIMSNVGYYAWRTLPVLIGAIRDYSPLKFFGSLSLFVFIVAMSLGYVRVRALVADRRDDSLHAVHYGQRRRRAVVGAARGGGFARGFDRAIEVPGRGNPARLATDAPQISITRQKVAVKPCKPAEPVRLSYR